MKDMRSITMDENAGVVVMIVGISTDVVSLFDNEHRPPGAREALRHDTSREAGPNNQIIDHLDRHRLRTQGRRGWLSGDAAKSAHDMGFEFRNDPIPSVGVCEL